MIPLCQFTRKSRKNLYYYYGVGVAKDVKESYEWWRKAAEQNYAPAQAGLAACYGGGQGVAQDYKEMVKWYRKAADQGYGAAQCNLADCYKNGRGVAQDDKEAFRWYRKAAEHGQRTDFSNVGHCYREGQGVAKDYVEAYAWLSLAELVAGDSINVSRDGAPPKLELVPEPDFEKQMSVEQIIAGKKRAKELRAMIDANLKRERK